MSGTTHPEFNGDTEGLEVAQAFGNAIRGKSILVTGVNRGGIGFTTAQAFVNNIFYPTSHLLMYCRPPNLQCI
jgi:hypothetical protein